MGASSTDTEVTVIVKYFYLLASKPQKSWNGFKPTDPSLFPNAYKNIKAFVLNNKHWTVGFIYIMGLMFLGTPSNN